MADTLPAQNDVNKDNNNNDGRRGHRRQTGKAIIVVVGAGSKHILTTTATTDTTTNSDVARWGLGGALALPFAEEGYNIVLMGRRKAVLEEVQQSIERVHQQWWNENNGNNNGKGDAAQQQQQKQKEEQPQPPKVLSVRCDVTDDTSVKQAFQDVSKKVGPFFPPESYIDLIIFNVAPPYPANFKFEGWGDVLQPHQIDTNNMTRQFDTQINGLIRVCQQATVIPAMLDRQRGCILLSGESRCNLQGGFEFGAVAPARAALRSLAQSMFQAYGPRGIHVCNINIGGVIDSPKTRTWMAHPHLTNPYEIAGQFLNAYHQPSTVWSYELQLSPGFAARTVDLRM